MDEVLLHVGDRVFLLGSNEAWGILDILCSANKLTKEYHKGEYLTTMSPPEITSAFVTPYTALLRMDVEPNRKTLESK